ncbi:MAG TPA: hypothetical protein P5545_00165 [Bacteroidota bacterium]|nr:hypothetical protein [Candidatus Kapabacteria bacterium]HRS00947.1 hypothetical protein [Bacteroidota bacterium]
MKRLPTINKRESKQVGVVSKTKKLVPYQSKISVEDVPQYGTPDGSSMSNEEMRRLRLREAPTTATEEKVTGGETPKIYEKQAVPTELWAETVKHNDAPVIKQVAQAFDFHDGKQAGYMFYNGEMVNQGVMFQVLKSKLSTYNTIPNAEEAEISATVKIPDIKYETGTVYINQLPLNPQGQIINDSNRYLYDYYAYTPANGYYGWYIYKLIEHNWGLKDKNNFIIQLVDLMEIDVSDGADVSPTILPHQDFIPRVEGLDNNRIIIHGIYKPDLKYYRGYSYTQQLYWINEELRQVRTNIVFKYNLLSL